MAWKGFGSSTPSSLSRPTIAGCPISRSFSRDVGYRRASPLALSPLSGKDPWYPTSREKRARYGAPGNCGRDRENCKTLRSVHSILDLPTGKSATPNEQTVHSSLNLPLASRLLGMTKFRAVAYLEICDSGEGSNYRVSSAAPLAKGAKINWFSCPLKAYAFCALSSHQCASAITTEVSTWRSGMLQ
jgi:hypothetical protein